jgi:hypothetical protein
MTMITAATASVPPASAGLQRKQGNTVLCEQSDEKPGTNIRERGAIVAFAHQREETGFAIPSAEDILTRDEDPELFNGFLQSVCSSVCKVWP